MHTKPLTMPEPKEGRVVYSVRELATAWGVSVHTIYGLINDGHLRGFRPSHGTTRVHRDEAERFMNAGGLSADDTGDAA